MKFPVQLVLILAAAPLFAQPQIGGGTCSTASLNGTYIMTLTGRQVSPSAAYLNVSQADGSIVFDGQSKVTLSLTQNTLKGVGTAQSYSGTYVVQANCLGTVSLTVGDTASFNLMIYNQGNDFLLAGTDATYNYTGGGSIASANSCAVAKLAGVYSLNATGYSLSGSAANGVADGIGLIQFDGKGDMTVNLTQTLGTGPAATSSLSGTYSLASSCLGTATLTDSSGNSYSVAVAATSVSGVAVNGFDIVIGSSGKLMLLGAGHPLYGQPTALLLTPSTFSKGRRV